MLSMRSSVPLPRVRRLSWLKAVTSTGPRAMASRTSLSERADSVNRTADGLVSARRDDGGVIEVRLRGFDRSPIGIDHSDDLILGLLLVDYLLGLEELVDQ